MRRLAAGALAGAAAVLLAAWLLWPPSPAPPPERPAAKQEPAASRQDRAPEPGVGAPLARSEAEPEVAPSDAGEPQRVELRARLATAVEEHLPDHKLSSEELDAATDALLRMRAARRELRALPRTPENASRLRELTEAIAIAAGDFEYVMDMEPAEFTDLVSPGEGGL